MRLFELTLSGPVPLEVQDPLVLDGRHQERIRMGVKASEAPRASVYRHPQTQALVLLPERPDDAPGAIVVVRPSSWECEAHAVVVGTSVLPCPHAGAKVKFVSKLRRCLLCGQKPIRGIHPMTAPAAGLEKTRVRSQYRSTVAFSGLLILPAGSALSVEVMDQNGTVSLMAWEVDQVGLHRAPARSLPALSELVPVEL